MGTHKGNEFPFTPQKVSLEILDSCNKKVFDINRQLPGLFVHSDVAEPENFAKAGTTILRQVADNVLKPSEEMGYPWCVMLDDLAGKKSKKFTSGGVEYTAGDDVIAGVTSNIEFILAKLQASSSAAGR